MAENQRRKISETKSGWAVQFTLRRFLVACVAIGVAIGLFLLQQQRQRKYLRIVQFVEQSFETGGNVPNAIAKIASPDYTSINSNCWTSSVARSPNNGPSFVSSEHELIYRPTSNGDHLVDLTIVTSWHFLESQPTIQIAAGGGEFDEVAVDWLQQNLSKRFSLVPTLMTNDE